MNNLKEVSSSSSSSLVHDICNYTHLFQKHSHGWQFAEWRDLWLDQRRSRLSACDDFSSSFFSPLSYVRELKISSASVSLFCPFGVSCSGGRNEKRDFQLLLDGDVGCFFLLCQLPGLLRGDWWCFAREHVSRWPKSVELSASTTSWLTVLACCLAKWLAAWLAAATQLAGWHVTQRIGWPADPHLFFFFPFFYFFNKKHDTEKRFQQLDTVKKNRKLGLSVFKIRAAWNHVVESDKQTHADFCMICH